MSRVLTILLGLLIVTAARAECADSPIVGKLGDPDQIRFVGNKAFDSADLRMALACNLEVIVSGHPDAPLENFLKEVERRLRHGYLHLGYGRATVAARHDAGQTRVIVEIDEGPRFHRGGIEVTGATTIPVDRLKRSLTSQRLTNDSPPKPKSPLWDAGTPAAFTGNYKSYHDAVKQEFQGLGYLDVAFSIEVRPEDDRTATLVISIQDEGPRAILGDIEITGAERNSVGDILRLVQISKGTVLDADTKAQIEKRLSDAARFLKHDVEVLTPPFGDAPSRLRISLVEDPDAPTLNSEFSAEERVFLKFADWANSLGSSNDDVELKLTLPLSLNMGNAEKAEEHKTTLRFVISHRDQACLLHARIQKPSDELFAEMWVHLTPKLIAFDSPHHKLRFEATGIRQTVIASVSLTANPPDPEGRMTRFNFGMGATSDPDRRVPLLLLTNIAPVAAVRQMHALKDDLVMQDGMLLIDKPDQQLAISAETGRLIKLDYGPEPTTRATVTCAPDLYQKALQDYRQQTADCRTIHSGDTPISNLLSFLATCLPGPSQETAKTSAQSLTHELLKRGAFRSFDELLLEIFDSSEDRFEIPADTESKNTLNFWSMMILPATRMLVPDSSRLWNISRVYVLANSRLSQHAIDGVQELLADEETGPVTHLISAAVFGTLNPQLRQAFARLGLLRLQGRRFRSDFEPFLHKDSPIGKVLLATAETLQGMDESELQSFVGSLRMDEADRRIVLRVLKKFPELRSETPGRALSAALDEAWEPLIEPGVREILELFAN